MKSCAKDGTSRCPTSSDRSSTMSGHTPSRLKVSLDPRTCRWSISPWESCSAPIQPTCINFIDSWARITMVVCFHQLSTRSWSRSLLDITPPNYLLKESRYPKRLEIALLIDWRTFISCSMMCLSPTCTSDPSSQRRSKRNRSPNSKLSVQSISLSRPSRTRDLQLSRLLVKRKLPNFSEKLSLVHQLSLTWEELKLLARSPLSCLEVATRSSLRLTLYWWT